MSAKSFDDPRNIALAKGMILRGDPVHDIAALFGENSGRVAEIKAGIPEHAGPPTRNGKNPRVVRGADVPPAAQEELPPPGPYFLNLIAPRDIIEVGLEVGVEQLALHIAELESRRADDAALSAARAARTGMHDALLERRRELWKGRK